MPVQRKSRGRSGRASGLGFEYAAAVAGFTIIGYWLGGYFGNAKLGIVIGAVLGVFGGMYNLIRSASAIGSRREEDSRDGTEG